jgi:ornithine cyclodeaminase
MLTDTPAEQFSFSIITGRTISRIIADDLDGCMNAVRDAYLAHANGQASTPISVFLRFADRPNARIIGLPTHLKAPDAVSGIKWIASYPDNVSKGFPRASAVIILNSHEHGYPFACLEGSVVSAARTAASAALAAAHLRPSRRAGSLGIVGTGLISRYIYRFLTGTGWDIDRVYLHDLIPERAEKFRAYASGTGRHSNVEVETNLSALLKKCDVTVFATIASHPHVHDPTLFEHCPLILHISLRDLAPEILLSACNIVDDTDHVMQAETSAHLTEQLAGHRNFITGTLADVMLHRCNVQRTRPIIFSPFGLGILDLAVGKWVYDRAAASTDRVLVNDFFYDGP